VEHHPSRRENRAEREQHSEDGEARELEPHGWEEAKKRREQEPDRKGRKRNDDGVGDHAASL
jgi:hypothetical protein